MRAVQWKDEFGMHRVSLIRDSDPDSFAPRGIEVPAPDVINGLDWDAIKIELQNTLVDTGLLTWDDVENSGNALVGAILGVMRNRIIALYRQ